MKSKRLLSVLLAGIITVTACGCNKNDLPAEGQTDVSQPLDSCNTAPETSDPNDISSQYEWGNVEIVGGGYVDGIYYNKAEEGLVYARTDIGGAYRMNKETGRWMPITDQFNNDDYTYYGIDGLATDEKEPNRVYLIAGMYGSWKSAVLRSDNYGETWEMTPLEFSAGGNEPNRFCDRLIIDPND
ncbi:MAG: cellulose-binding protein, partial [Ruminiclostridium sp.]|nr:cellulose-binding protein [Ruminiclostridium sp.]